MSVPASTYRLQLTTGFTLHDAARVVPYTRALGISHLYLSPILEATAGSAHGYDVTDPARVRGELGGDEGLAAVVRATRAAGMGILLDIVPNHMAASAENPFWRDLLEFGVDSPHARTFDLSWRSDPERDRLLLTVLGEDLDDAIESDLVRIDLDSGGLIARYGENVYPLAPCTYAIVLRAAGYVDGSDAFAALGCAPGVHGEPDPRRRERAHGVRDAWLVRHTARVRAALATWQRRPIAQRNHVLRDVLERQSYELASWRRGASEIAYRRFFDVSELAGVRVEDPAVYEATHARTLEILRAVDVDGLRIDHVDGLRDPGGYLEKLSRAREPAPYVVVEKILAPDEALPAGWPVAGTTGYEFANTVGGWFIRPDGWRAARAAYVRLTGNDQSFDDLGMARQRRIIDTLFRGELRALVGDLIAIVRASAAGDWADDDVAHTLAEVSACLDVYRTYVQAAPVRGTDRVRIARACERAAQRAPGLPPRLLAWLRSVLLLEIDPPFRPAALEFVLRWQQFTGPVMAKGFEDTALYNDFTLICANEVGGDPGAPAVDVVRLHEFLADRARRAPGALSATSTHDTKRSEDVRLRIAALSLFPDDWTRFLDAHAAATGPDGSTIPTQADRILLLQTLLGTWPEEGPGDAYAERVIAYMTKAMREAKSRTSWRDPDPDYEAALADAVRSALDPGQSAYIDLAALAKLLTRPAQLASLAQTLIKITAPGVPDFYQGAERWHHALVDPDNRAPVDYEAARCSWASLVDRVACPGSDFVRSLLAEAADGRIKLLVTAAALRYRLGEADLFANGRYVPLAVAGESDDVFAFARSEPPKIAITVVARPQAQDGACGWSTNARIRLPAASPRHWRNVLTGSRHEAEEGGLGAADVLDTLPCALLVPA